MHFMQFYLKVVLRKLSSNQINVFQLLKTKLKRVLKQADTNFINKNDNNKL